MENEGVNSQTNTNIATVPSETPNNPTVPPSEKAKARLSAIFDKLGKSPLFAGKRKFISIPLIVLALAAVIVVPILIINNIPQQTPREAFVEWANDLADNLDEYLANNDIPGAIRQVESALETETALDRRLLLFAQLASLHVEDDYVAAIATMGSYLAEATNENSALEEGWSFLGDLYYASGQPQQALGAYNEALLVANETGYVMNTIYYVNMIEQIQSELNGAGQ